MGSSMSQPSSTDEDSSGRTQATTTLTGPMKDVEILEPKDVNKIVKTAVSDDANDRSLPPKSKASENEVSQKDTRSSGGKAKNSSQWGFWKSDPDNKEHIPNPGAYDEINQEATLVLRPNLVDGLSFNFNAPLSESFMMGSTVEMGGKTNSGQFAFNANYITNRLVMLSRTSPENGRVNGRIFLNVTPAMTAKLIADVGPEPESSRLSCDIDYRGLQSSSQLKFASGRIIALNHIHSITPRFSIGGEVLVQARTGFTAMTMAFRHSDASRIASLSIGNFGPVIASYVRKVNPKVSFAAELFVDSRTKESHLTAGYKFDLTTATIAGHVDTSGRVAAMLEERINPALSLTLSGELDHVKDNHNFGFGINIGSG